jgi:transposase
LEPRAGTTDASQPPDAQPKKKRGGSGYNQRPGTVQRGMKVQLYPAPVDSRWVISDTGKYFLASVEVIKAQPTLAGKPIRDTTLEAVRARLPPGLVCVQRKASSGPGIVERWIIDGEAEWQRQTRIFDRWCRRVRELWNLLLRLQRAAYSGANDMPHLGWRKIWAQVADENYRIACEKYEEEYPGCLANPPPPPDPLPLLMERIARDMELGRPSDAEDIAQLLMSSLDSETRKEAEKALKERLAQLPSLAPAVATTKGAAAFVKQLRQMTKAAVKEVKEKAPKQPPVAPDIDKILARNLTRPDGTFLEPCLFIWEADCQKLMALLKQVPHTRWIGELPSHAAQHVVKDLCKALRNVSKGWGFPAFKRNSPDGESVYFANTQLTWDIPASSRPPHPPCRVKLPGDVGWVTFDGGRAARRLRLIEGQAIAPKEGDEKLHRTGEDKFLGARLWRKGKRWYLSPQFEVMAKPVPRFTGRHIAVKLAASQTTVMDDKGGILAELATPAELRHRHEGLLRKSRSRQVDALTAAKRKATRRANRRREALNERRAAEGLAPLPAPVRPARIRRSREFLDTNAAISRSEGSDANRRNDHAHKTSHRVVRMGDSVTIEHLDVASMMKKEKDPAKRREAQRKRRLTREGNAAEHEVVHKAPPKVLRKALRRAAPSRLVGYIEYKAEEAARPVTGMHMHAPNVIMCGAKIPDGPKKKKVCGHLNYVMRDGRSKHQCGACGAIMHRLINAVENIAESGRLSRESGLEAAE